MTTTASATRHQVSLVLPYFARLPLNLDSLAEPGQHRGFLNQLLQALKMPVRPEHFIQGLREVLRPDSASKWVTRSRKCR